MRYKAAPFKPQTIANPFYKKAYNPISKLLKKKEAKKKILILLLPFLFLVLIFLFLITLLYSFILSFSYSIVPSHKAPSL